MTIKKLEAHIINKLKAWEVVERPSSVVKELIENSLDAWADNIILEVWNWWKSLIKVEDDGEWISNTDLDKSIQSYATSKISSDEDLLSISSYWFRWEALATISEVSKFTIQTKSKNNSVASQLQKIDKDINIEQIPFHKESWTIVLVQDLFFNVPARQKFLKSEITEYNYILDVFLDFAIINYNKNFRLIKNWKIIKDFKSTDDMYTRILDIFKTSWWDNLKILENESGWYSIFGVVSDSSLTFPSPSNIKIFVNKRPVQDKIIKKSVLDSYKRQLAPWEYPLIVLFIDLDPSLLDVNVHPRKLEVKFKDPNSIFNFVQQSINKVFAESKVSSWYFSADTKQNFVWWLNTFSSNNYKAYQNNSFQNQWLNFENDTNIYTRSNFSKVEESTVIDNNLEEFQVIWQIWDSYIIVQWQEELYFVDQHALAERIAFEKMKNEMKDKQLESEIILNPIWVSISWNINLESKIDQLSHLGFDISLLWENDLAVYAVPKIFLKYNVDIQKVLDKILYLDEISLDIIFEEIFAMKACKTSIKAGDRLSMPEMVNLINDWYKYIDKMFVCQHWRPSIVSISKNKIENLFDRH